MVTRFLVLMPWGRVGSNLILDIIGQHGPAKLANESLNSLSAPDTQMRWLNEFYEIDTEQTSEQCIGSKQSVRAICDLSEISLFLSDNQIRLIRMRRDNLVKAAISQIRAEQYANKTRAETGSAKWAVPKGDDGIGRSAVDPNLLVRRIRIMQDTHDQLMSMRAPPQTTDIEYGEIVTNLDRVIEKLRDFLGLRANRPIQVRFEKATSDHLSDAVSNLDEVRARLAGSRYEAQLED